MHEQRQEQLQRKKAEKLERERQEYVHSRQSVSALGVCEVSDSLAALCTGQQV
jgi:hypothetical protein